MDHAEWFLLLAFLPLIVVVRRRSDREGR